MILTMGVGLLGGSLCGVMFDPEGVDWLGDSKWPIITTIVTHAWSITLWGETSYSSVHYGKCIILVITVLLLTSKFFFFLTPQPFIPAFSLKMVIISIVTENEMYSLLNNLKQKVSTHFQSGRTLHEVVRPACEENLHTPVSSCWPPRECHCHTCSTCTDTHVQQRERRHPNT